MGNAINAIKKKQKREAPKNYGINYAKIMPEICQNYPKQYLKKMSVWCPYGVRGKTME
jgi:hypothetical protein